MQIEMLFSLVCMHACMCTHLASTWLVELILFISDIYEFLCHKLVPIEY